MASASLGAPSPLPYLSYGRPPTPTSSTNHSSSVVRHVCNLSFLISRVMLTTPLVLSTVRRQSQSKSRSRFIFPRAPLTRVLPQVATPAALARCAARGTTQTTRSPHANTASPSASLVPTITSRRNAGPLICTEPLLSLTCPYLIPGPALAITTGTCVGYRKLPPPPPNSNSSAKTERPLPRCPPGRTWPVQGNRPPCPYPTLPSLHPLTSSSR